MSEDTYRHRAKKSLGQNFLMDGNVCRRIVEAIAPGPGDTIIEIGPGQGALTGLLADSGAARLMTIELDNALADRLAALHPRIEMIRADALDFPWESLDAGGPCKIVGNLPYNVASKLIWDIVSRTRTMQRGVFMVQHEVALRLTAEPGGKAYGGLTAWVRNFADTRYLFKVPPTVFRPRPKVDSAVVSFTPMPTESRPADPEALARLIKMLFQMRRKQLSTILKPLWNQEIDAWFKERTLSPAARPETLTPGQFRELSILVRQK
ncbi:ribosomal RNA small subunit methyltransferase A [Pseudodesulfovibrio sp. F-1]|uniref:Ribosomal RNA small subunit methyltransferase A n=1 Tax=Pseudodesulfovibrio alkaliphilus TaxID=2661613 RepID=A0A7K1KQS6_9BACT|nr:16S rRNA (adenine(1518)-N(6)/adenine(1519)-N(6))-dimethyltransferase RsmA [Pseudodesulfovibrio alkaliphilus]MUM78211.1 ribosomal RNA small subunit methyltransferase A [Pseudodesulfovibrio alkaliphilus]